MATIGTDLALLAHDDVVRMRAGGSSSMPGKRNPIDATRAVAAAEACGGAASIVTRGRPHELERGVGGWHAEWLAVPLVLHTSAAAVEATAAAVATLEVVSGAGGSNGPTPATGTFVDRAVDGLRPGGGTMITAWADDGDPDAPPIVLLHSLGSDRTMWGPQVEALRGDHRLVRVEARGHGRAPSPPGPYTIDGPRHRRARRRRRARPATPSTSAVCRWAGRRRCGWPSTTPTGCGP